MIRINDCKSKTTLKAAFLLSAFLLFAAATGFGQQAVNLTAGPAATTTPDGTVVPMWGYRCGAAVTGSTATCAPLSGASVGASTGALGGVYVLTGGSGYTTAPTVTITPATGNTPTTAAVATAIVNGGKVVGFNVTQHGAGYTAAPTVALSGGGGTGALAAAAPAWSPVLITVPTGATGGLSINLTNNLSFTAGATTNAIPTSIVMVGQVGGGLGGAPTTTASPSHADAQGCPSWFIASQAPGVACTSPVAGASGTPPTQAQGRVRSMGTEVAAVAPGTVAATTLTWAGLKPGTYLLESGTHPSIQAPMGLIGMLVVTTAPAGATAGTAYPATGATTTLTPAVTYNAEVPLEFSEIDPVQNKAVDLAVRTAGFSETRVWSGEATGPDGAPGCGYPGSTTYHQCYPPAVNYTPFYYLINGLAFDKTHPAFSLFAATAGVTATVPPAPVTTGISATGTVLARLVNAGSRMHVPSFVGSQTKGYTGAGVSATVGGFTLIAEDGNVVPGVAPPGATTAAPVAPKVQTDVFMAAGKTFDVMVNVPAAGTSLPIYDRELSLSANSSTRDAGMLAYVSVNGSMLPVTAGSGVFAAGKANSDAYAAVISCPAAATSCVPLVISDPSKGVIANDVNVYGVELVTPPLHGALTCNAQPGNPVPGICANGTFTYTPVANTPGNDTFGYCANGASLPNANLCTTVTLTPSALSAGIPSANNVTFTSKMATFIKIPSPGVLTYATDPNGLPMTVGAFSAGTGVTLNLDPNGGFTASVPGPGTYIFTWRPKNSLGMMNTGTGPTASATVTLVFPQPSHLQVNVLDAQAYNNCNGNSTCIAGLPAFPDYRWIIEEDKTFYIDPNCTTNSSISKAGCPSVVGGAGTSTIPTFGINFHTSTMDYVAQGCTGPLSCEGGQTMLDTRPACTGTNIPAGCSTTSGQHIAAVCDLGNGACRPDTTGNGYTAVNPSQVHLDPSKRYYISVLPGDAANPFPANVNVPVCPANGAEAPAGDTSCGHTMSGAPIPPACNILIAGCSATSTTAFSPVNVLVLPTPMPTGKLSVVVFEDDFPLNGEQDNGGGVAVISPVEPGLGGFNLVLWDTYGGLGDVTGQDTYDMFNMPLSNSLAGTIDPSTNLDACPISATPLAGPAGAGPAPTGGITGMIVTCPKYEADQHTLSPLAGQAVIDHLMPEKFSVQAYPGADRIARGEQWIQTNTLDGQHAHDSFIRIGEPSFFQEYGPAGYHVAIGFANPAIINNRVHEVCTGLGSAGTVGPCTNTIDGTVNVQRLSRIPDERLYPSGSHDALAWTQCWVSLGDPDGEDFMFTFCDANGYFSFKNVPGGNWRVTIGDQWNDQIIDGLSTPANVGCIPATQGGSCPAGTVTALHLGNVGVQQWQSNLYTKVCVDDNKNGICDPTEIGIPLIYTMIHYRDGHTANNLTTDFNGVANFNEEFPLFNWYVVEADSLRYKTTGIHTVYDAGGPADGTSSCGASGARACGTSAAYQKLANTFEAVPLPADLSIPGAVYCAKADCTAEATSFAAGTAIKSSSTASTGRIDPPWVWAEGWAGLTGTSNWIEFAKAPYAACNPNLPVSATNFCATVSYTPAGSATSVSSQVGENGGIHGLVAYASTRPFDSAEQMIQQPWEPNVPNVTVNLYQENFAADGVTPTLSLVDTTVTTSWDAWAQGFYPNYTDPTTGTVLPYMSCPGQGTATAGSPNQDLFYFTLFDQPNFLDWYTGLHSTPAVAPHPLPYNSQYKCYDAMKINNQTQPAQYDGRYFFPSSLGINPATGTLVTTKGCVGNAPGTVCPAASGAGVTVSNMTGTNCTICVGNPDSTDKYRFGTPMLPPGKYVVQVIMPPGYEVYKEEDKNLLIGDNFIAPVTQQFGGLGTDIFILPDQASVASMYDNNANGVNSTNYQNQTQNLDLQGGTLSGVPGFPGFQNPLWPCVGEMRVVPDYLSIYPQAHETAPFAGATRPLCDRKEVTLTNQTSAINNFSIFTSTHIASKFTGVITDDFTSEFDPFSPQFGEKFAPPNMSISTKDYLGNELSRVYSDHWGVYNGLTFSSWEVNPPNITGYSPTMLVQCMNDPGPIKDTNPTSPTFGQLIQDPLYNPAYSDFCYEEPYMPGLTTYLDTPVVPTQAFVGAGYNNADCSYPDATPAIKEVDGSGIGPWVSGSGVALTITALGDQQVNNNTYSGPSANTAPFNMKTITRHYGFGTRCTSPALSSTTCNTMSSVTIGGVSASISSWSDTSIVVTVPSTVPNCNIQQQAQFGGSTAQCGQLIITAGNGKQSIDSVTVTIGGKTPTHVAANQTVQSAIDAAAPGDLIIVDPTCMTTGATPASATCSSSSLHAGTPTQTSAVADHSEMLLMWKPVRLQGVGAASSIIDANAIPAGKQLNPWRRHVNCLFGLTLQGVPTTTTTGAGSYDPTGTYNCPETGWQHFTGIPNSPQIDRLALEATVGWDASLNGNLAEQLQEPSLMGAYEGAGITVLARGLDFHGLYPWNNGTEPAAFPTGTTLLTGVGPNPLALPVGDANPLCVDGSGGTNRFPSNFTCNPSSIDGLTIRDSSQGGGGIFAHGWAHHLQIANNRVYNNAGTLTGGISVGQGEFPPPIIQGDTAGPEGGVGSCSDGTGWVANQHLPGCLQIDVNVHNNYISQNSSLGDELFSGTLSGGGGATLCTGNDYYKFNYNWVCGNLSSGEGGGIVHLGETQFGDIEHNSILLNQSQNPTIPTNGGGIMVEGTPDTDPVCTGIADADCPPGLSDGVGHNLIINANLIQGNSADSGSGGGIRLQQVNGTDVSSFPTQPNLWNNVSITNNIIVNNVAGWDGAGISLQDSLRVAIVNNTIASNDTVATSGVLTQSLGTPMASAPAGNCVQPGPTGPTSASCPQSAGVTSMQNSTLLTTTFTGPAATITCPYGAGCMRFSNPLLQNNVIWQNRSFYIGVSGPSTTNLLLNQQNQVALFDAFTGTAAPVQTAAGQCTTGVSYWDLGVRGDRTVNGHESGFQLSPTYSVLDDPGDYASGHNLGTNPSIVSQYCNGSRVPPTCTVAQGCGGPGGYGVPPGIADALSPNPVFSLTPAATVDEGNNWINMSWGPLSLSDDAVAGGASGNYGGGALFANYALNQGSVAIDYVPVSSSTLPTLANPALGLDFFGHPRPDPTQPNAFDVGAVEFQGPNTAPAPVLNSISPASVNRAATTTAVPVTLNGSGLGATSAVNVSNSGITVTNIVVVSATQVTATFNVSSSASVGAHTVSVTASGVTSNTVNFTVVGPTLTGITPATGLRGSAAFPVTLNGTNIPATGPYTINITPGSGITAGALTYNGGNLTTTFTIPASAPIQTDSVSVTTSLGQTGNVNFAVTGPTLTSISPASANRGPSATGSPSVSVPVTLTGTNFVAGSTIVTGTGISVVGTPNVTPTQITATLSLAPGVAVGTSNVSVSTPANGSTNAVGFTVKQGFLVFTVPGSTTVGNNTITIANNATGATAGPITFTGISVNKVTGTGTFAIVTGAGAGTCTSTTVLNPGSSCTVIVSYTGGTAPVPTANITLTDTGASPISNGGTNTTSQTSGTF